MKESQSVIQLHITIIHLFTVWPSIHSNTPQAQSRLSHIHTHTHSRTQSHTCLPCGLPFTQILHTHNPS